MKCYMAIDIPLLFLLLQVSGERLNVSKLLISSPEWVCAERGETRGVRNDDLEDLAHC